MPTVGAQVVPINLDVPLYTPEAANMSLTDLSAAQAVQMLCARDVTAVQYASALLAKAQQWECVNAWSEVDAARVRITQGVLLQCSAGHFPSSEDLH